MRLTRSRRATLIAKHGRHIIASMPRSILLRFAATEAQIEKLKQGPGWFKRRIDMIREVLLGWGPPPPPRPLPPVPARFRNTKISHWYKDHMRRIGEMAEDSVCRIAVGYEEPPCSPDDTIAAFNGRIAPIAKLYGFQLRMEKTPGENIVLSGDTGKAGCVLLHLSSERRTPEIDWMLDVVTAWQMRNLPVNWKQAWKKLRHTKRGKMWRRRAKKEVDGRRAAN